MIAKHGGAKPRLYGYCQVTEQDRPSESPINWEMQRISIAKWSQAVWFREEGWIKLIATQHKQSAISHIFDYR
jgi:hypothetical protein